MDFSAKGQDLLKQIESLRLKPYNDQTGQDISSWVRGATIGYGHLILQNEWDVYKNGITKAQAEQLFADDSVPYVNGVNGGLKVEVQQHQFDAMVILTYNIGVPNFLSSSALKLINDPNAQTNYSSLESAWKAWNRSQGRVTQGLINRRNAEWKIYSQGIYETW
ncbi:MAG: hypothetical protein ETSY2_29395 [Candidatus Entotheonella gemina]|uniref:Lysozyme n=1 Tax=Candidatus Entotheonella gemina TaxID=1429439 RepID=W4M1Y1_9BACT|nr:MAG: hypothetical protein ETSY2_29395 [Candidatus Entotheonella gemina]